MKSVKEFSEYCIDNQLCSDEFLDELNELDEEVLKEYAGIIQIFEKDFNEFIDKYFNGEIEDKEYYSMEVHKNNIKIPWDVDRNCSVDGGIDNPIPKQLSFNFEKIFDLMIFEHKVVEIDPKKQFDYMTKLKNKIIKDFNIKIKEFNKKFEDDLEYEVGCYSMLYLDRELNSMNSYEFKDILDIFVMHIIASLKTGHL